MARGQRVSIGAKPAPAARHEASGHADAHTDAGVWIEIDDGARTWRFERAFLLSSWRCVYGAGCRGIHPTQDATRHDGCCTYGAHLAEAEDFVKVHRHAQALPADLWQHRRHAQKVGWFKRLADGTVATRVVGGACVFLNRPGFAGGTGCALHLAALADGARPLDRKPDVCWELPLRCEDGTDGDGRRVVTVRRWEAADFGREGRDMTWWCTDATTAPEAFAAGGDSCVADTLAEELLELCGAQVVARLRGELGLAP